MRIRASLLIVLLFACVVTACTSGSGLTPDQLDRLAEEHIEGDLSD